MTKLTYQIVTTKGTVLKRGIPTLNEAQELAATLGAKCVPEYTTIREKTHFDRSKCRISEDWLAQHTTAN